MIGGPSRLCLAVGSILVGSGLHHTMAIDRPATTHGRGSQGAPTLRSSESCRACHEDTYQQYVRTSHARTMREVSPGSLQAQFTPESEYLYTGSSETAGLYYQLLDAGGRYYQILLERPGQHIVEHVRLPLDLEMGSGHYARAYLRWHGDALFLLPLSYYTAQDGWAFGPGMFGHRPHMLGQTPLNARCLECHSGYFEAKLPEAGEPPPAFLRDPQDLAELSRGNTYRFNRETVVLPISCVSCHGSAEEHVRYQQDGPGDPGADPIARLGSLSRMQQVDVCARCHAPPGEVKRPPFTFEPGDDLDDFQGPVSLDLTSPTPHGTQAPYLRASACFQQSPSMTCSTCHEPHRSERRDLAGFSGRCLQCHEAVHPAGDLPVSPEALRSNCIDCHMPNLTATNLRIRASRGDAWYLQMRTHLIRIYEPPGALR